MNMKKNITILLLVVCSLGLIWSCNKDLELHYGLVPTANLAFIKVIDASPNFRAILKGADSFNIYVNNAKVNGNFFTYAGQFPSTGSTAGLYAAIPSGAQSIRVTVNGKVTPDSITLLTLTKVTNAGGYYSLIITDSILTANETKQMWLTDQFALTDTLHYSIRFVDAVMNDPAAVDVYSYRQGRNIFSAVAPGSATTFQLQNYTIQADTLSIRTTGTTTEITRVTSAILSRMRAYTLLYRGMNGGVSPKARAATLINNQ